MALGSGVIADPPATFVTNNDIVANADKVMVIFQNNSRHTAKVIGSDEKTEALCSRSIPTKSYLCDVGNSDDAKVGDWVVAVGNPFGLGGSVTAGPSLRSGVTSPRRFPAIDAPINRGNSGGPTLNLHGQVIG